MSRAGKYPVKLSEGVSVAIVDNALVVKGPKRVHIQRYDRRKQGV